MRFKALEKEKGKPKTTTTTSQEDITMKEESS